MDKGASKHMCGVRFEPKPLVTPSYNISDQKLACLPLAWALQQHNI